MRSIYWDAMLLIYLMDGNPKYHRRMLELLKISYRRKDRLLTSYLALGEVLAGVAKSNTTKADEVREKIDEIGFEYLPFDSPAVPIFAKLRAIDRVKAPDAMHLSCAGAAGTDLFLTGDKRLHHLHVPGIHFIADIDTSMMRL